MVGGWVAGGRWWPLVAVGGQWPIGGSATTGMVNVAGVTGVTGAGNGSAGPMGSGATIVAGLGQT
jgi:hypothetical protein